MAFILSLKLLIFLACFLQFQVEGTNITLDECLARFEKIEERLQKLESVKKDSKRFLLDDGVNTVAFYTQLSKDVGNIGNHQTIIFDIVTTNVGHGYNPVDGIFTAPLQGTYVFFWLNTNKDHSYMNTELVKNSTVVGKSMSDAADHADYAAASNSAVLQLKAGEEVWVRSGTWHSGTLAGDYYSTFSGWLLYVE
ncbi:complement C1q-like protein 4 [Ruditapes philippinarum]|uniref:complement C1q-like protein 4 n=1 Tax=Ruditapes philippinarum TaxID=129788 RepID=UPI00295BBE27|nr:complement C1q-like protein 4 [Ruditapes philippinarum]